jgi:hypothetical protein
MGRGKTILMAKRTIVYRLRADHGQTDSYRALRIAVALIRLALRVRVTNVHCPYSKVTLIILERHPTSED